MVRATNEIEGTFSEINVTPFTDVLLVLLVIFMILAALVVPPGFERRMNGCTTCTSASRPKVHATDVFVTRAAIIFVGNVRTTELGLYDTLARLAARDRHVKIRLVADARARYSIIIRVLDAAKAADISDVSFVTQ